MNITFPLIKSVQGAYSTHVQYEREKAKQAKEAKEAADRAAAALSLSLSLQADNAQARRPRVVIVTSKKSAAALHVL